MKRTLLAWLGGGLGYVLLLPIIAVGLPFWIVALLTRTVNSWISPGVVKWTDVIQFDSIVGWKPKPGVSAVCEAPQADVFHVETDQEGWRGPVGLDESQIVVFGDSYAFGYAVNRPFFDVSTPEIRIKAIAAQGYNMVQELLLMTHYAPRLRGKLVVWFIYPGNDLTDNLSPSMWGYRSPCVLQSDEGWEIFTKHLQPEKWPAHPRFDRHKKISAVFGRNVQSDRVYSACEYLIARGQDVCRRAGVRLVLLTIPWTIQFERLPWHDMNGVTLEPDLPEKRIGEICTKLGVEFLSGTQHFAPCHYIPNEGHLNEEGHRHLARLLNDVYKKDSSSSVTSGVISVTPVPHRA